VQRSVSSATLRRFQRRVEDALEAVGGDRDAARKFRDAVADAARGQGQSGVTSAIQVGSSALAGARLMCSGLQEGRLGRSQDSVSTCNTQAVPCADTTWYGRQVLHACMYCGLASAAC